MSYSIYIAGPIMAPGATGGLPNDLEVAQRRRKFDEVAEIIRRNVGSTTNVVNPLYVPACRVERATPVCEGIEDGPLGRKHSWQCYLRHDLEQLVMCNEVVMLEGWRESPGATVEYQVACMLRLEISFWCNKHTSAHPEGPCK